MVTIRIDVSMSVREACSVANALRQVYCEEYLCSKNCPFLPLLKALDAALDAAESEENGIVNVAIPIV